MEVSARSASPTKITSVSSRGNFLVVKANADKESFKLNFTQTHDLVSINRWVKAPWVHGIEYCAWRCEFHRAYNRKGSLSPLHVDLVVEALGALACARVQEKGKPSK